MKSRMSTYSLGRIPPELFKEPTVLISAEMFLRYATYSAFVWIPFVFAAYALGRRRVSIWFFLAFTAAEAIAVLLAIWIYNGWWSPPLYQFWEPASL